MLGKGKISRGPELSAQHSPQQPQIRVQHKKSTGMKGKSLSILGILAAVAGAILVLCFKSIKMTGVTITGGVLFVGVGLINLLFFSSVSKAESATGRVLTLIANAASIVLGVSMLVFESTFTPLITFIFGLLVAVCALWQFFVLAVGARPFQLPAWLYLFPILLAGGSAYIFIRRPETGEDHLLMLATGISLVLLGIACVLEGSILGVARRADRKMRETKAAAEAAAAAQGQIEETHETSAEQEDKQKPERKPVETTEDLDDEVLNDDED